MNPPLPLHTDGPNRRAILAQPADTNPEERRMKDIDWNGLGRPPIGAVCLTELDGKDIKVEILAYGKHGYDDAVLVAHLYDGVKQGQMYGWIAEQCEFLPIRTPEQIAAEERDAAIEDMYQIYKNSPGLATQQGMAALYDAGYRMTAEDER